MSKKFAVIDTETNWRDEVMSIGVIMANKNFKKVDSRYYVLSKQAAIGGMFSETLYETNHHIIEDNKDNVIEDLSNWFKMKKVRDLYAYNASFDKRHLPEFSNFNWYDIMKIAAYKQYNPHIKACHECCNTGRLKRGYGVESMLKLLGINQYCETHNAINDAEDELLIMKLLNHNIDVYPQI